MGWIDWISFPATIALKTTVLTEYLILLVPALQSWNKPLAVAITSSFAALQIRGVVLAANIQQVAAAIMSVILVSITLALLLAEPVSVASQTVLAASPPGLREYGLVLAAIVFTYDGWLSAAYFGGEIKGGGGAVARSCVRAVLIILVLYVGLNQCWLSPCLGSTGWAGLRWPCTGHTGRRTEPCPDCAYSFP
jgi:APA family basic amino acid/polyamine antiporter